MTIILKRFRAMISWRVSILALALVLTMPANHVQGLRNVTVEAAVNYVCRNNFVLLFAGEDMLMMLKGSEFSVSPKFGIGIPADEEILAANMINEHLFIYGPDFYDDYEFAGASVRSSYSESLQEFLGTGGPDAVSMRGTKVFYFKDCNFASYDKDGILQQRNAQKLGLPCNPDAAWNTEDWMSMVLLKGDEIWLWDFLERVEGPMPFTDMYDMTSWQLIPMNERDE